MSLVISSGPEIQLAQDQVGHVDEVLVGTIAAGLGLGGLDEAVEAFENPVGDLALESAEHAFPVIHDGVGDLDQGR